MLKKEEFGHIMKTNIMAKTQRDDFGYKVSETGKTYDAYYTEETFRAFINEMETSYPSAFHKYDEGKGSELKEHTGRYGRLPPKMASVASSSRFCYLALRDGAEALGGSGEADFEHEARISGVPGIAPQLDAYIPNEKIYVEVKCHEIFDAHSVTMKEKYWSLIYGPDNQFGFPVLERSASDSFEIPLACFDVQKTSSMFDVRQFLCHLLGIASQKNGPATLVYLFFKPKAEEPCEQAEIDAVFEALRDEIQKIFSSSPIRQFCSVNRIGLWAVAECAAVMEPLNGMNLVTIAKA